MPPQSQSKKSHHVCPWWLAYTFDNSLRRMVHPADKTLAPYVRPGMSVADIGCGFGHFTMGLARLVGPQGRVLAVDLQQKMLDKTMARLRKAGLADRAETTPCRAERLGLSGPLDFILAANVVHETPDPAGFFAETAESLAPAGLLYVMEPSFHVPETQFQAELDLAADAGFEIAERPTLTGERCIMLQLANRKARS
jgi:ubiquinone/menaquinone biosynthesis C-methylase UbiE